MHRLRPEGVRNLSKGWTVGKRTRVMVYKHAAENVIRIVRHQEGNREASVNDEEVTNQMNEELKDFELTKMANFLKSQPKPKKRDVTDASSVE